MRLAAASALCLLLACAADGGESAPTAPASARPSLPASASAARAAATAKVLVEGFDAAQRRDALYAFGDRERFDLRLAPIFLEGASGEEMNEAQWNALGALLGSVLSPEGLAKARTIMSLEREVEEMESRGAFGWLTRSIRGERNYYLALFGEPQRTLPWGFRVDGHHLSLNFSFFGGASPASTPLFLGAQPRKVPQHFERAGLRVLAEEEDAARKLAASLDAAQRERAFVQFQDGRALFQGAGRRIQLRGPREGLPRGAMRPDQRARLDALIDLYVSNFAADIAETRRAEIASEDRDAIAFAWASPAAPEANDTPLYYRIQGRSFLIEYDDSGDDADHVHTLFRSSNDFGMDLLAQHYAAHHR